MVLDKILGGMRQNDDAFMAYWIIAGFSQMEFYMICNTFEIIIEFILINSS